MPLFKYVNRDKSKMISFVTTKANSALKRSVHPGDVRSYKLQ